MNMQNLSLKHQQLNQQGALNPKGRGMWGYAGGMPTEPHQRACDVQLLGDTLKNVFFLPFACLKHINNGLSTGHCLKPWGKSHAWRWQSELEGAWSPNNILSLKALGARVLTLGYRLVSEVHDIEDKLLCVWVFAGRASMGFITFSEGPMTLRVEGLSFKQLQTEFSLAVYMLKS